jgi:hypothetical protein
MRFVVADIAAYHEQLIERGLAITTAPAPVTIAPYGDVMVMAVRSPDGAWFEFVEWAQ